MQKGNQAYFGFINNFFGFLMIFLFVPERYTRNRCKKMKTQTHNNSLSFQCLIIRYTFFCYYCGERKERNTRCYPRYKTISTEDTQKPTHCIAQRVSKWLCSFNLHCLVIRYTVINTNYFYREKENIFVRIHGIFVGGVFVVCSVGLRFVCGTSSVLNRCIM